MALTGAVLPGVTGADDIPPTLTPVRTPSSALRDGNAVFLANLLAHDKITSLIRHRLSIPTKGFTVSDPAILSPSTPPLAANGNPVARPKTMRRPAHFSHSEHPLAPATVNLALVAPTATPQRVGTDKTAPTTRPWQDDGRFAVILLALVIAVNVVVIAWLGAVHPPAPVVVEHHEVEKNPAVHLLDSTADNASTEQ